jgi:hypothetical protein
MLTTFAEGLYSLEDHEDHIELEGMDCVDTSSGIFVDGCMILARGIITEQGKLSVERISMLSAHPRKKTLYTIDN